LYVSSLPTLSLPRSLMSPALSVLFGTIADCCHSLL